MEDKNVRITQFNNDNSVYLKDKEVHCAYFMTTKLIFGHHSWQPVHKNKLIIVNMNTTNGILIGSDGTIEKA